MRINWQSPIDDNLYELSVSGMYEDFVLEEVCLNNPDKTYKIIDEKDFDSIGLTEDVIHETVAEHGYELDMEHYMNEADRLHDAWKDDQMEAAN